jgi:hypothetical protein
MAYQQKLNLIPYEDGEHVMVLYSGGEMDDAWYRASDEQLVDRCGRIIGRPGTILHKRDRERRK